MLSVTWLNWFANLIRTSLPGLCLFVITTCVEAQAVPESLGRDDRIGVCTHFGQNWPVEQIMNAAAKEIKLGNPHMEVIGLGTPAPASFRMIALGLAPQVDGLTDHPYGGKLPELVPYASNAYFLLRDGIATADANGTLAS